MAENSGKKDVKPGKLIAFEGLDGGGSTTQSRLASEYLASLGILNLNTKEPTNNLIGGLIRGFLTGQWGEEMMKKYPLAGQLLFCADRAHHLSWEIEPALEEGKWVLLDRYEFSTIAYGLATAGEGVYKLFWEIQKDFPRPDLTFFFNTRPDLNLERIDLRGAKREYFEAHETLELVAAAYKKTFEDYREKGGNVVEIEVPLELDIQDVHLLVRPHLDDLVSKWRVSE